MTKPPLVAWSIQHSIFGPQVLPKRLARPNGAAAFARPPPPRAGCHATSDVGAAGVGRLVKGCEMMTMMGISWEYPTIIGYIAGMPNFYNGISLENPTIVTMEYHGNSQLLETLLSFESCRRCRQRRVPRSLVSSGRLSWPSVLLAPGTTQLGQTVRFRTIQDH